MMGVMGSSTDKSVMVFPLQTEDPVQTMNCHDSMVWSIHFDKKGQATTDPFSCIFARSLCGLFVDIIFSWEICVVQKRAASRKTPVLLGLFVEMTCRCVEPVVT